MKAKLTARQVSELLHVKLVKLTLSASMLVSKREAMKAENEECRANDRGLTHTPSEFMEIVKDFELLVAGAADLEKELEKPAIKARATVAGIDYSQRKI